MKNASNNRELAHLWANQSCESAKGSNFYFEGPKIFSYGPHFPVAKLVEIEGRTVALFNPKRYSPTTSQHQAMARSAACHLESYHIAQDAWHTVSDSVSLAAAVEAQAQADLQAVADSKAAAAAARARAKAKAKAERERLAAYPEELAAWRAGAQLPRHDGQTALRVTARRGKAEIETSKGAFVPVAACRKVWPVLDAAVHAELVNPAAVYWQPFFSAPNFKWGMFEGVRLRRIAIGSPVELIVGCHTIAWEEIILIASELGLAKNAEVTA